MGQLSLIGPMGLMGKKFGWPILFFLLPLTLRGQEAGHFWQGFNFADTTDTNRERASQGIADFILLLDKTDSTRMDKAVASFLQHATSTPWGKKHYPEMIHEQLGSGQSYLCHDKVYACFLRHLIAQSRNEAEISRLSFRLEQVSRNQTGSQASDFSFELPDGHKDSLYHIRSPWTLLYFSDPTCSNCHRLLPQALESPVMYADSIQVIMVYPDDDRVTWENTTHAMPDKWMETWAPHVRERYYLPSLPSLYLLDRQKRVVLKNTTLDQIARFLKEH